MRISAIITLLALLVYGHRPALAAELNMPYELGVGIHFGTFLQHPRYKVDRTIAALRDHHLFTFRDDLGWSFLSPLAPTETDLPDELAELRRLLLQTKGEFKPIIAITAGDPGYNGGQLPTTEAARADYAMAAAKAARLLLPFKAILEIWNEWNLGTGTRAHKPGTPNEYVALIKRAYPAIKATSPGTIVLVGGMGTDISSGPLYSKAWAWTEQAIDLGLLNFGDGLSVHLYNTCRRSASERTPSEMIARLQLLDNLIARSPRPDFPIFITEVGWPDLVPSTCGFTPKQQMDYLAQFMLSVAQFQRVKAVLIYELKDADSLSPDLEKRFGMLNSEYYEKPYMCALDSIESFMSGATFSKVTKVDGHVILKFKKSNRAAYAVYAESEAGKSNLELSAGMKAHYVCSDQLYHEGDAVEITTTPLLIETSTVVKDE